MDLHVHGSVFAVVLAFFTGYCRKKPLRLESANTSRYVVKKWSDRAPHSENGDGKNFFGF